MSKKGKKTKADKVIIPIEMPKSMKEILEYMALDLDVSQASIVRKAIQQYFNTLNPETK